MIEVERGKPIWAMGLMSGTSMDGVDAATVLTDGELVEAFGEASAYEYSEDQMARISYVIERSSDLQDIEVAVMASQEHLFNDMPFQNELEAAEDVLLVGHAQAVKNVWESVDQEQYPIVVGFHGQTIAHAPDKGWTWQLGDGNRFSRQVKLISRPFRCSVVWDFRSDDMKAGGQGAPLAPFYHFALAKHIGATEPVVFINIGGVANITWVDPRKDLPEEPGALMAFDTGPGNALVNDWMFQNTNCLVMDVDGATASTGRVHRDRLKTNWGRDYLRKPGPKSLDRNDFHGVLAAMQGLSINDGAATLTAFTADCVAESLRHMPTPPTRWLVCGGGRHNHTMMQMLQDRLDAPVEPVEAVGLDGDMLEAQAFAYLAVRVLRGLPTSAPSTTGCSEPVCGGRISYPT